MAITQKIKKRSGEISDFQPEKITIAVQKAFAAVMGDSHDNEAAAITRAVADAIDLKFGGTAFIPSVEDIQDLVENALMQRGFFTVAKSYIIYRYEHEKVREVRRAEVVEKIIENALLITKRDGRTEAFNEEKLATTLARAASGFEDVVNVSSIVGRVRQELYEGMKTKDIQELLIMVVRSLIERDPAYSSVAARLLLQSMYREVIGDKNYDKLEDEHKAAFIRSIKRGVEVGQYNPELLSFNLERLGDALQMERDLDFKYLGLQTLQANYLSKVHGTRELLETPQIFWMRVAMGCALSEKTPEERERHALQFYEIMSAMYYTPSSPTLYHAGLNKPQLSSCFLMTVPDDLHAIFKNYSDGAQLLKYAGGLGTDWTPVRATGSLVKTTGVESQGLIPFLKIANDVTISINRSGRRRGAAAVYLEYWHADIEDFLELRKNTGDERRRAHDLNTAVWIPDLFMKRLAEDGYWTLFSPSDVPDLHDSYGRAFEERYVAYEHMADEGKLQMWKRIRAADLWRKNLTMLFETGHPWVTWKDPSNIRSPQDHVGVVHSSNLCCMTADQRVVTSEGLVTVGYLYEKAKRLGLTTPDGGAALVHGSVNTVFGRSGSVPAGPMLLPRPNAPIVRIVTHEGYAHKVTPDHKVWVVGCGWVEAQKLKPGDRIETQQAEGLWGQTNAAHEAYVCGLIAGDGTFMVRDGTTSAMIDLWTNEFGLIEEIEHSVAHDILGASEDAEYRTTSVRAPRFIGNGYKKRLTSAPLARALARYGFTRETKLTVPEFVWTGTRETVAAYVRGLYAADATVESSGGITTCALASTSEIFLSDVQILLSNFGIKSSLSRMREAGTALFPDGRGGKREYAQDELWRLMVTSIRGCKLLEDITGLGALRGNEQYLANLKKVGYAQKLHATFERLEPLPSEDAYCLRVFTDEHSWTVNGLITKNTEITLNTSANETAVCNLGSVNLARFINDNGFDRDMVARVVPVAMRMLDNVIDVNFYPTEDTKRSNFRHRPVGLGLRGLQDALYKLALNFDSDLAVRFSDESMECIAYHAILASSLLAKERGTYETYKGSKWDRGILPQDTIKLLEQERGMKIDVPHHETLNWQLVREAIRQWGMRNSNTMANAPTATTANIAGCYPTVEPIYKNIYVKSNMAGDFMLVNEYLVNDLKELGLWNEAMLEKIKYYDGSVQDIEEIPPALKDKYKEVFEMEPQWLIKAAAYRGRWIDQSQSLNIFYGGTSGKVLSEIYQYAWSLGLKTTYYLRTLGASRIEKSTVNMAKFGGTSKSDGIAEGGAVEAVAIIEETVSVLPRQAHEEPSFAKASEGKPSEIFIEMETVPALRSLGGAVAYAPAMSGVPQFATKEDLGLGRPSAGGGSSSGGKVEQIGEVCESCSA